jgi:hypothetical protein
MNQVLVGKDFAKVVCHAKFASMNLVVCVIRVHKEISSQNDWVFVVCIKLEEIMTMTNDNHIITREALQSCIDKLARVQIAHLPTPLEFCPRLTKALGGPQIWLKLDDCTGLAFGGNKTRQFGQFYINVYSICNFDELIIFQIRWSNRNFWKSNFVTIKLPNSKRWLTFG